MEHISRKEAFELLKKYNKDPFHIQHALTVEAVMKWYANELGYGDDAWIFGVRCERRLLGSIPYLAQYNDRRGGRAVDETVCV